MKFKTCIKAVTLAGLASFAIPMSAQAALTFGEWTVTTDAANNITGQISGCPTAATGCTALVQGEGFLQQQVDFPAQNGIDALGNPISLPATSYIRTIITDPNANALTPTAVAGLPYFDESYVQTAGGGTGIVGKQTVTDAGFNFSSSSELYIGWGTNELIKPAGKNNLNLNQQFTDVGVSGVFGDEFQSNFDLKVDLAANGTQSGKSMTIGQIVEMGTNGVNNTTDIQRFLVEQRTGSLQTQSNPSFALAATSFDAQGNPINGTAGSSAIGMQPGGVASWTSSDDVMLVWLGQNVSADTNGDGVASIFGYESVTVTPSGTTTPSQFASTFSNDTAGVGAQTAASVTAPFNWDQTTFGVAPPTLPVPAIANPNGTFTDSGVLE